MAIKIRRPTQRLNKDFAYGLFLALWRLVIYIFFREIRPRGTHNIPKHGPVILVAAPHHNQFVDPLILMSEMWRAVKRPVAFLVADKSMRRPEIGYFARMMQSIAVVRATDNAKAGNGSISFRKTDLLTAIGHETCFTGDFKVRDSIEISYGSRAIAFEIAQIDSQTEITLKRPIPDDIVMQPELWNDGMSVRFQYRILPFVDQGEMYQKVHQRLSQGGCVGVFPEGGSHDRTDLLPLKVGVTIMALGAMQTDPAHAVRILPVGLSYFHPHKFRSRAVIEFGKPIDIPEGLVALFKKGGQAKRQACTDLLDIIYDGLKSVTIRAPDYETLTAIQVSRRLYTDPRDHLNLAQVTELNKRLTYGYNQFKDDARINALKAKILAYNRLLINLGLKDHQIQSTRRLWPQALGLLLYRSFLLILWGTLALPGLILNAPIFIAAKYISVIKAQEALAASNVKVKAFDVVATWKVLVTVALTPIVYLIYSILGILISVKLELQPDLVLVTPLCTLLALPAIALAALKFGEVGTDIYKSLAPLILALIPGQQKTLLKVQKEREALKKDVTEIISVFGRQIYGEQFVAGTRDLFHSVPAKAKKDFDQEDDVLSSRAHSSVASDEEFEVACDAASRQHDSSGIRRRR